MTHGDCVLTTGINLDKDGYPRVKHQSKFWRMNRLIYTFVHGEIPQGKVIGHTCNNPGCINPHHLYLTTAAENSSHAARDKLYKAGPDNGRAKLTKEQVLSIRYLYDIESMSQEKIAKQFNVSQATISQIVLYKTYKEV